MIKDEVEGKYWIGFYICDLAVGIGMMIFFELKIKKYGVLGYVIFDMDMKKLIVVEDGEIVYLIVIFIEKGKGGNFGEKLVRFLLEWKMIGDINCNSLFGIFGKLY